jgi:hypothetical protein
MAEAGASAWKQANELLEDNTRGTLVNMPFEGVRDIIEENMMLRAERERLRAARAVQAAIDARVYESELERLRAGMQKVAEKRRGKHSFAASRFEEMRGSAQRIVDEALDVVELAEEAQRSFRDENEKKQELSEQNELLEQSLTEMNELLQRKTLERNELLAERNRLWEDSNKLLRQIQNQALKRRSLEGEPVSCAYEDCEDEGWWRGPDGTSWCRFHAVYTAFSAMGLDDKKLLIEALRLYYPSAF